MPKEAELVKCPYCNESIQAAAILCRFCGTGLSDERFTPCPLCAEMIKKEAIFCRHCKTHLAPEKAMGFTGREREREREPEPPKPAPPEHNLFNITDEKIDRLFNEIGVRQVDVGKIETIGRFLLDAQDTAKIQQLVSTNDFKESKIQKLTLEISEKLKKLLARIDTQEEVLGSCIIGHDGLLLVSTLPQESDPESLGVWALGIYLNTINVMRKLGHQKVFQIVIRSGLGSVIIVNFSGGILVTITNTLDTRQLITFMGQITDLAG